MNTFLLLNLMLGSEFFILIDLLKEKNVHNFVQINCKQEKIIWSKMLNYNNVNAASVDIHNKKGFQLPVTHKKIGIYLNISCSDWQNTLKRFPTNGAFKCPYVWFILTENLNATINVLSNLSIEIDSDVTIIYKNDGIFKLYDAFHTDHSSGYFTVRQIGSWNKTLNLTNPERRDLSGLTIKSMAVITDKLIDQTYMDHLFKPRKNYIDSVNKLKYFELFNYIKDMYNFR
jgi:hypothetical protein